MNDIQMLDLIYNHLDRKSLLRAATGLTGQDIDAFFSRVRSELAADEPRGAVPEGTVRGKSISGEELLLYTDGASRGNPGPAAIGCVLDDAAGGSLQETGVCIGRTTNNVAEYRALLYGIELAARFSPGKLAIFCDSELLVKQMTGAYKTRDPKMRELKEKALGLLAGFKAYSIAHITRRENARADALANKALNKALNIKR